MVASTEKKQGTKEGEKRSAPHELDDPKIAVTERQVVSESGEVIKEITTTETRQVTVLKPVEIIVEEAVEAKEVVEEEEGELDIVWLSNEIATNTGIASLELTDDGLSTEEIVIFCQALEVNHTLTKLDLSGNEIGNEGIRALIKALRVNKSLRELLIGTQQVVLSAEVEQELADTIYLNESLLVFNFTFHNISLQTRVEEALSRNKIAYESLLRKKKTRTVYVAETTEVTTVKKDRQLVHSADGGEEEVPATAAAEAEELLVTARSLDLFPEAAEILSNAQPAIEEATLSATVNAQAPGSSAQTVTSITAVSQTLENSATTNLTQTALMEEVMSSEKAVAPNPVVLIPASVQTEPPTTQAMLTLSSPDAQGIPQEVTSGNTEYPETAPREVPFVTSDAPLLSKELVFSENVAVDVTPDPTPIAITVETAAIPAAFDVDFDFAPEEAVETRAILTPLSPREMNITIAPANIDLQDATRSDEFERSSQTQIAETSPIPTTIHPQSTTAVPTVVAIIKETTYHLPTLP
ncbi:hypothetical protein HDU83_006604 [Entophlyctis luteolus]|nr:hypothetical protein HDU83_006604 [Entophlyctis luteolus]